MENKASQDKLVESGSKSLEEHKEEFDWLNKNVRPYQNVRSYENSRSYQNVSSYQYRLTRVFLVVWGTMFPQYNPRNQNKFPVSLGMENIMRLEWVGNGDSTMRLLHMRHQNEANSHNKQLNCKNQVLHKKSFIHLEMHKKSYHYCCHYGTIFALVLIELFLLRPYEVQFDDIGFRKFHRQL